MEARSAKKETVLVSFVHLYLSLHDIRREGTSQGLSRTQLKVGFKLKSDLLPQVMSIYSDKLTQLQVVINCQYFVAQMCT